VSHAHYHVEPRYTAGSGAMVPEAIARRVAAGEKSAVEYVLKGYEGEKAQALAERLGLRGIAEERIETGSGKSHGWKVHDLCTGERFFRLCREALLRLGWRQYPDLAGWERELVDRDPPAGFDDCKRDYRQAYYKFQAPMHAGLPVGWQITVYRPEPLENGT
jgi:hypothetical protein